MFSRSRTVLGDFSRSVRNEPFYYIYKHRIYVTQDSVAADEVTAWLRKRYIDSPKGHRYRVGTYTGSDGKRYVDCLLMETLNDADAIYIKLKWGYSLHKIQRGTRLKRKRLSKDQKTRLDGILAKVRAEFYATEGF